MDDFLFNEPESDFLLLGDNFGPTDGLDPSLMDTMDTIPPYNAAPPGNSMMTSAAGARNLAGARPVSGAHIKSRRVAVARRGKPSPVPVQDYIPATIYGSYSVPPSVTPEGASGIMFPPPVVPDDRYRKVVADKKRQDRNAREQQRSLKISKQIENLKELLEGSGVSVKSSKFSVLEGVADYLKSLQDQIDQGSREVVELGGSVSGVHDYDVTGGNFVVSSSSSSSSSSLAAGTGAEDGAADGVNVMNSSRKGITNTAFKSIVLNMPTPLALAAWDGTIVACNDSFKRIISSAPVKRALYESTAAGGGGAGSSMKILNIYDLTEDGSADTLRDKISHLTAMCHRERKTAPPAASKGKARTVDVDGDDDDAAATAMVEDDEKDVLGEEDIKREFDPSMQDESGVDSRDKRDTTGVAATVQCHYHPSGYTFEGEQLFLAVSAMASKTSATESTVEKGKDTPGITATEVVDTSHNLPLGGNEGFLSIALIHPDERV